VWIAGPTRHAAVRTDRRAHGLLLQAIVQGGLVGVGREALAASLAVIGGVGARIAIVALVLLAERRSVAAAATGNGADRARILTIVEPTLVVVDAEVRCARVALWKREDGAWVGVTAFARAHATGAGEQTPQVYGGLSVCGRAVGTTRVGLACRVARPKVLALSVARACLERAAAGNLQTFAAWRFDLSLATFGRLRVRAFFGRGRARAGCETIVIVTTADRAARRALHDLFGRAEHKKAFLAQRTVFDSDARGQRRERHLAGVRVDHATTGYVQAADASAASAAATTGPPSNDGLGVTRPRVGSPARRASRAASIRCTSAASAAPAPSLRRCAAAATNRGAAHATTAIDQRFVVLVGVTSHDQSGTAQANHATPQKRAHVVTLLLPGSIAFSMSATAALTPGMDSPLPLSLFWFTGEPSTALASISTPSKSATATGDRVPVRVIANAGCRVRIRPSADPCASRTSSARVTRSTTICTGADEEN